ncbi:hypothetical protein GCM10008956_14170 [Deinococcus arenae]|uniref:Type 4 fimbrial biogenesis protein PilX N-terminal domain-containing protein n=1 Tax=Deinococcus arenae TaxID=1452751 RepID=A0A8H9GN73_9DEIO|nr:hypothetical protein [Deinococcus arenae]GGM38870.1 hypothetical protein GCM10008956_14170 [Deinococcus arenae]
MNIPDAHAHTLRARTGGYLLISALLAMAMLMLLVTAYMFTSLNSPRTSRANADSLAGFMAAEGGLNMRAALIRSKFVNFERPSGGSVTDPSKCASGSGDFQCVTYPIGGRNVATFVYETTKKDAAGNLVETGTVAPGETYAGLSFQQYAYRVVGSAVKDNLTEANVEMEFQSRLVPLFQFAAFYTDDLEINPGAPMTLNGRVHTNKDLYLAPVQSLNITGQTTAGGAIRRVRKDDGSCNSSAGLTLSGQPGPGCFSNPVSDVQLAAYKGQVKSQQAALTVPKLDSLAPDRSGSGRSEMWSKADVRVVMNPTSKSVTVQRADGSIDTGATATLNTCGAISASSSFYDSREETSINMMDVDQAKLMACIQNNKVFTAQDGKVLSMADTSGGGLALHFSFDPEPTGANANKYAVRIRNGATLGPAGGPAPKGLSIATNQPLYVQGSYNATNSVPASLMGDTINVLSNAWVDGVKTAAYIPPATSTEIHAAFLGGTDSTATGNYNGGLENYPRLHENWAAVPLTYVGSFVSLGTPTKARGNWKKAKYSAPNRIWSYDTQFNSADKLPPLTPRFVYLRQLFFARDY